MHRWKFVDKLSCVGEEFISLKFLSPLPFLPECVQFCPPTLQSSLVLERWKFFSFSFLEIAKTTMTTTNWNDFHENNCWNFCCRWCPSKHQPPHDHKKKNSVKTKPKKKDVFIQKKNKIKSRGEKKMREWEENSFFFFHSFIFIVVCFYWIHTLNASASFMNFSSLTLLRMTEGRTFFSHSIDLFENETTEGGRKSLWKKFPWAMNLRHYTHVLFGYARQNFHHFHSIKNNNKFAFNEIDTKKKIATEKFFKIDSFRVVCVKW